MLGTIFIAHTAALGAAVALLIAQQGHGRRIYAPLLVLFGLMAAGAVAVGAIAFTDHVPLAVLLLSFLPTAIALAKFQNLTIAGRLFFATGAQAAFSGAAWGIWFLVQLDVSTVTKTLMLIAVPFLVATLPSSLMQLVEGWEVLCRRSWRRPRKPLKPDEIRSVCPKVSLHVPSHAEPPAVVIETLEALSRLDYPNFEVLVIDNNTNDPALWGPLEAACTRLGERFRFFHVEGITGAKAGALNYVRQFMAEDAELVSVIDADYVVAPEFLKELVGYFDDGTMGFVQTPHDYRGWQNNAFLRMCYWEYRYFFHTSLVSQNERDSAIIVGTMCVVRRKALEDAGGWAEWCATEDSELAIRIHALGYSSIYLTKSYGWGLIPETFSGYKKQRFRWTVGPVQEFKRHLRLYLPSPLGLPSKMSFYQRLHHLNHGLENIQLGINFFLMLLGVGVIASLVVHQEVIPVPFELWLSATVMLITAFVQWVLVYRHILGASWGDMLGAILASRALSHTRMTASAWGMITPGIAWHRTNKFTASQMGLRALASAWQETAVGLGSIAFAVGAFVVLPQAGLLLMLAIGAIYQSVNYLAAPVLALLAERSLGNTATDDLEDSDTAIPLGNTLKARA